VLQRGTEMVHWHRGLRWCVTAWDRDGAIQRGTEMVHWLRGLRWCFTAWELDGALQRGSDGALSQGTEIVTAWD